MARRHTSSKVELTEEQVQLFRALHQQSLSVPQIALRLGVPDHILHRRAHELEIDISRSPSEAVYERVSDLIATGMSIAEATQRCGVLRRTYEKYCFRNRQSPQDDVIERTHEPLRAGHPFTWRLLVDGTSLADQPNPFL